MIARVWKGWTQPENADAYEALLRETVIPGLQQIPGHRGAYIMRHEGETETEFLVTNLFETLDAVKVFAGENYAVAVFEPEAKILLSRVEPLAQHYMVKLAPEK